MAPGSLATFSTTFALAGIGKLPNSPLTLIVRLARAGADWLAEADADAEVELRAAGLVVAVLAVVVPRCTPSATGWPRTRSGPPRQSGTYSWASLAGA